MSTPKEFFTNPLASYESFETYGSLQHQSNKITALESNYDVLLGKMDKHVDKRSELKAKYQDFDETIVEGPDTGKKWLDKRHKKSTVKDAVKEDTHVMIIQQNNAYIIGMITLATVLITTFLVIKK